MKINFEHMVFLISLIRTRKWSISITKGEIFPGTWTSRDFFSRFLFENTMRNVLSWKIKISKEQKLEMPIIVS